MKKKNATTFKKTKTEKKAPWTKEGLEPTSRKVKQKKMAHTLQSVRLCRKLARSAPWSSCRGDGLTVIRWKKKSDEKTTLDTFVVSQQTDFDSVNQALYIGKKKSLQPKKNQSAREIQNWPTD